MLHLLHFIAAATIPCFVNSSTQSDPFPETADIGKYKKYYVLMAFGLFHIPCMSHVLPLYTHSILCNHQFLVLIRYDDGRPYACDDEDSSGEEKSTYKDEMASVGEKEG